MTNRNTQTSKKVKAVEYKLPEDFRFRFSMLEIDDAKEESREDFREFRGPYPICAYEKWLYGYYMWNAGIDIVALYCEQMTISKSFFYSAIWWLRKMTNGLLRNNSIVRKYSQEMLEAKLDGVPEVRRIIEQMYKEEGYVCLSTKTLLGIPQCTELLKEHLVKFLTSLKKWLRKQDEGKLQKSYYMEHLHSFFKLAGINGKMVKRIAEYMLLQQNSSFESQLTSLDYKDNQKPLRLTGSEKFNTNDLNKYANILFRSKVASAYNDRGRILDSKFLLNNFVYAVCFTETENEKIFNAKCLPSMKRTELTERDFDHIEQVPYLITLLRNALQEKRKGINILLYGEPGTGKTELARMLIQSVTKDAYEVLNNNWTGTFEEKFIKVGDDGCNNRIRTDNFFLIRQILRRNNKGVILYDEAEDFFRKKDDVSQSKGFVNDILENNINPTIWTMNSLSAMEKAYFRRFTYVLNVDELPRSIYKEMIGKLAAKHDIEVDDDTMNICMQYKPNLGIIDKTFANYSLSGYDDQEYLRTDILDALQGQNYGEELPPIATNKFNFNPDLINASIDLKELTKQIKKNGRLDFGMLLYGVPGCHAKGTKIVMYDGSLKAVEDIKVGDKVMGPDSTERTVLATTTGQDMMYRITTRNGDVFDVNSNHVLSFHTLIRNYGDLKRHKRKTIAKWWSNRIFNMTIKEYLALPDSEFKKHLRLYYPEAVNFNGEFKPFISPYLLGLLLGDGYIKRSPVKMCSADKEIEEYLQQYTQENALKLKISKPKGKTFTYTFNLNNWNGLNFAKKDTFLNPISKELAEFKLLGKGSVDKFIPSAYKCASKLQRYELLAGLLDTDGSLSTKHKVLKNGEISTIQSYVYTTKSKQLADDVTFVARSLGLRVSIRKRYMNNKKYNYKAIKLSDVKQGNYNTIYYALNISGKITEIPCKISRKKASFNLKVKDSLKTNFTLTKLNTDTYYGFTLDKDHLYLMDNMIVTHNSSKSSFGRYLAEQLGLKVINKNYTELASMYVGETEHNIAALFKEGTRDQAVIILDEADVLLRDRTKARASWEVSQTEALLTEMENYGYPFIMTTNLFEDLDAAVMRRFLYKVKHGYLTSEQVKLAFKHFFGMNIVENLHLSRLTSGDFALVKKQAEFQGKLKDKNWLIDRLTEEMNQKKDSIASPTIKF